MNTQDHKPDDPLERWARQALRDLPARRAPGSLEARVMAEIERRAARAWWQLSFMEWPTAVRIAFVLGCTASGVAAARMFAWLSGGVSASVSELNSDLAPATASVRATASLVTSIAHQIPPGWVYGGAAVLVLLYVGLFGIGAIAYRTLYATR
jgi:hypothetical protein